MRELRILKLLSSFYERIGGREVTNGEVILILKY